MENDCDHRVLVELFNFAINGFDAKKLVCCSKVLAVTELVQSNSQCDLIM